jgi:hypothetical protein
MRFSAFIHSLNAGDFPPIKVKADFLENTCQKNVGEKLIFPQMHGLKTEVFKNV